MHLPKPATIWIYLVLLAVMTVALAQVQPDEDFHGYMQDLQEQKADAERTRERLEQHEIWRQTTWGGYVVRQLQALGKHFGPFFFAIEEAMSKDENGPVQTLVLLVLRVLLISGFVAAIYAFAHILQRFLGREIVIEEEVVIDHDADEDEVKTSLEAEPKETRRSAREKKNR